MNGEVKEQNQIEDERNRDLSESKPLAIEDIRLSMPSLIRSIENSEKLKLLTQYYLEANPDINSAEVAKFFTAFKAAPENSDLRKVAELVGIDEEKAWEYLQEGGLIALNTETQFANDQDGEDVELIRDTIDKIPSPEEVIQNNFFAIDRIITQPHLRSELVQSFLQSSDGSGFEEKKLKNILDGYFGLGGGNDFVKKIARIEKLNEVIVESYLQSFNTFVQRIIGVIQNRG